MIEYRTYTPADRDAALRILTEGMTPTQAAAKAATFDWQFIENPHDDGRSPFILAVENDHIVAVNGMMPARVIYQGTRRMAVWTCDAHVLAPFRGRAIATEMKRLQRYRADVMIAYGISDALNKIFDTLGWQASRELEGYYFHSRESGVKGVLKNLRSTTYRTAQRARKTAATVTLQTDSDFDAEVDELWAHSAPTYFSAVERDAAYLNWKYRRHPFLSYRRYDARRDGRLSGVLLARSDPNTSVIVDYCGPLGDDDLMADLVHAAVTDLCDRGTVNIRCETTDAGMARALHRNGFRQSPGKYRFRVRCNCFDDPHPSRRFFLMTGDSDNDFTNALTSAA